MKAETALSLWNIARMHDDAVERITAFARACEQHVIERAKALAEVSESDGWHKVDPYIDWSALDAEVAEENADG